MHKIATEPSDSSWMKACGTNNSIRFSAHKGDTIEPYTSSTPLVKTKVNTHCDRTHTHFPTWKVTGAHTTLHYSSTDGSHWYSTHQLSQKEPLNLQAYLSSFYAKGVHSTQSGKPLKCKTIYKVLLFNSCSLQAPYYFKNV